MSHSSTSMKRLLVAFAYIFVSIIFTPIHAAANTAAADIKDYPMKFDVVLIINLRPYFEVSKSQDSAGRWVFHYDESVFNGVGADTQGLVKFVNGFFNNFDSNEIQVAAVSASLQWAEGKTKEEMDVLAKLGSTQEKIADVVKNLPIDKLTEHKINPIYSQSKLQTEAKEKIFTEDNNRPEAPDVYVLLAIGTESVRIRHDQNGEQRDVGYEFIAPGRFAGVDVRILAPNFVGDNSAKDVYGSGHFVEKEPKKMNLVDSASFVFEELKHMRDTCAGRRKTSTVCYYTDSSKSVCQHEHTYEMPSNLHHLRCVKNVVSLCVGGATDAEKDPCAVECKARLYPYCNCSTKMETVERNKTGLQQREFDHCPKIVEKPRECRRECGVIDESSLTGWIIAIIVISLFVFLVAVAVGVFFLTRKVRRRRAARKRARTSTMAGAGGKQSRGATMTTTPPTATTSMAAPAGGGGGRRTRHLTVGAATRGGGATTANKPDATGRRSIRSRR